MKHFIRYFLFLFLFSSCELISQNALDSLHSNCYLQGNAGLPGNYSISLDKGELKGKSTFGFDWGVNFKKTNHFYPRLGFRYQSINLHSTDRDSTYYSSSGFVGYSDLTYHQKASVIYVGVMVPISCKRVIICPKADMGYSIINKLSQRDNLSDNIVFEDRAFGHGYYFSPGIKFLYSLNKTIYLYIGYGFSYLRCKIPAHLINSAQSTSETNFSGNSHEINLGISLNLHQ